MPISMKQLPDESIIKMTVIEPFDPDHDMPAMFAEFLPLRMKIQGPVALVIDMSGITDKPDAFSQMVFTLAQASKGIKEHKSIGVAQPPITIFVGSGLVVDIASQAMEQEQYGGVKATVCTSYEEALALAREKL